jgi:hypothetical protein
MKLRFKFVIAVVALFNVACGGPGSFNGTVAGKKLDVEDSVFVPVRDGTGKTIGAYLVMADVPDICATLKANREPKGATALILGMMRIGADGTFLAPDKGDYAIVDSLTSPPRAPIAFGSFQKSDSNCTNELAESQANARSGLVKIDAIELKEGGSMSGSFDITFGSQGDKTKGTFNAAYCFVPDSATGSNCE